MDDDSWFIPYIAWDENYNFIGGFCQAIQPEHANGYIIVTLFQQRNWVQYVLNSTRDGLLLLDWGEEPPWEPQTPRVGTEPADPEPEDPPVDPEPEPPVQSDGQSDEQNTQP